MSSQSQENFALKLIATSINIIYYLSPIIILIRLRAKTLTIDKISIFPIYFRFLNSIIFLIKYCNKDQLMLDKTYKRVIYILIRIIQVSANVFFLIIFLIKKFPDKKMKALLINIGGILIIIILFFILCFKAKDFYHPVIDVYFDAVIFPLEFYTPGENTFKLIKEKNKNYISIIVSIVGIICCIFWMIEASINSSKFGVAEAAMDYTFRGIAIILCTTLVILYFVFGRQNRFSDIDVIELNTDNENENENERE